MKLNYKLKVFLIAFVLGVFTNITVANNPNQIEINVNNSDNWELVKEENGVKAYISQYVDIDGTLALKIKFENTTNQEIKLSWSLINHASKKILSENHNVIEAKGAFLYMNDKNPIPVNYGETINDLSIIFK